MSSTIVDTLKKVPEVRVKLGIFHADFLISDEYRSTSGRAIISHTMPAYDEMMQPYRHPSNFVFSDEVAEKAIDNSQPQAASRRTFLKNLLASAFLYGMAPGKQFVGMDMLGLPTERVQTQGIRLVFALDGLKTMSIIKPLVGDSFEYDLGEMFSQAMLFSLKRSFRV